MKRSNDRILSTHAGNLRWSNAPPTDPQVNADETQREIAEVVRRQREAGIDIVSDGELGRPAFWEYFSKRLGNVMIRDLEPGETASTSGRTNDRLAFPNFYADPRRYMEFYPAQQFVKRTICTGPITYVAQTAIQREIELFKAALEGVDATAAFMCVQSPAWIQHRLWDEYYGSEEAFQYALADAMKVEYEAIANAGMLLQIDDPALVSNYDETIPLPSIADYRRSAAQRVEVLNHALAGISEEQIRYHVCWGSWHGPHTFDLPLKEIVDLMLSVRAGAYLVEAGNVRHELDWQVWQEVKLPDGKLLGPGVVSHATNVVETPELVAYRIRQYADLVGRENVIATTDCGMGDRAHPEIAWAKLNVLAEGARMASRELFP